MVSQGSQRKSASGPRNQRLRRPPSTWNGRLARICVRCHANSRAGGRQLHLLLAGCSGGGGGGGLDLFLLHERRGGVGREPPVEARPAAVVGHRFLRYAK